ncbi:hypothetical protein COU59_00665 [Candidatus Pacearchaeota archaeon CG10_big_fil_rev_8_21_14_0_10_34_12]|nr:MAG: hypothetical protein COU59_00665 [Candidatus Pacearchaeota archaeon CG10_big_fil_rev_8_21_14_0_10_34_12]
MVSAEYVDCYKTVGLSEVDKRVYGRFEAFITNGNNGRMVQGFIDMGGYEGPNCGKYFHYEEGVSLKVEVNRGGRTTTLIVVGKDPNVRRVATEKLVKIMGMEFDDGRILLK